MGRIRKSGAQRASEGAEKRGKEMGNKAENNRYRKRIEVVATDEGVIITQGEHSVFVEARALPRLIAGLLDAALSLALLEDEDI